MERSFELFYGMDCNRVLSIVIDESEAISAVYRGDRTRNNMSTSAAKNVEERLFQADMGIGVKICNTEFGCLPWRNH